MKPIKSVLLVSSLLFTTIIRVLPSIYTGVFFSNDTWPLLYLARDVLENPGVNIYSLKETHGYHATYPLSVLTSVIYTLVTGISLDDFFKYIGVLTLSTAMFLLVYTYATKLTRGYLTRLIAAMAISLMPSFVVYTSAYLKEFYGYALIPLILYFSSYRGRSKTSTFAVLLVAVTAIVVCHPLASAMSIAILLTIFYLEFTWYLKTRRHGEYSTGYLIAGLIMTFIFVFYNSTIAMLPAKIHINDLLAFCLYVLAIYVTYFFFGDVGSGIFVTLISIPAFLSLLYTVTAPASNTMLVLYALPPVFSVIYKARTRTLEVKRESILLPVATLILYLLTYMVEALGVLHRVLNYLVLVLVFVVTDLFENNFKLGSLLVTLLVVITATTSTLVVLNEDPYTFYWRYGEYDIVFKRFAEVHITDVSIYGDPKYNYMVKESLDLSPITVSELCSLQGVVVLSRDNHVLGVPITPIDFVKLPINVFECRSVIFNAGYTYASA